MPTKKKLRTILEKIGMGEPIIRGPGEPRPEDRETWVVSARKETTDSSWERFAVFPSKAEADDYAAKILPKLLDGNFDKQIFRENEKRLISLVV